MLAERRSAHTVERVPMEIDHGTVLFAYDGSDHAKEAIAEAGLQLERGRHAVVLTVWRDYDNDTPAIAPVDPPPEGLADMAERDARKLAAAGVALARFAGFDATPLVESGDPIWRRVIDVADAVDASLVVLGSHGRSGIGRLLMGSVAAAVAAHTDRDVLVVHLPRAAAVGDSHSGTVAQPGAQELS
jgi:nucleotide-binding universal stress UspA family protein